jgi:hypothetical protein
MSFLYHYTTGDALVSILQESVLTPTTIEPGNLNEVPTVIFSANPVWEKSRFRSGITKDGHIVIMDRDMMIEHCQGIFRIVVPADAAPLDWYGIKEHAKLSQKTIDSLYELHVRVGAKTSEWFASTSPVTQETWIDVQTWKDDQWVSLLDLVEFQVKEEEGEKTVEAVTTE